MEGTPTWTAGDGGPAGCGVVGAALVEAADGPAAVVVWLGFRVTCVVEMPRALVSVEVPLVRRRLARCGATLSMEVILFFCRLFLSICATTFRLNDWTTMSLVFGTSTATFCFVFRLCLNGSFAVVLGLGSTVVGAVFVSSSCVSDVVFFCGASSAFGVVGNVGICLCLNFVC